MDFESLWRIGLFGTEIPVLRIYSFWAVMALGQICPGI